MSCCSDLTVLQLFYRQTAKCPYRRDALLELVFAESTVFVMSEGSPALKILYSSSGKLPGES